MPQLSPRNHRNNPYPADRLFAQVHHSTAGVIWRFRTEITALLAGMTGIWELAKAVTFAWAAIIITTLMLVVMAVPPTRRLITRRHGACCPGTASSGPASRPGCTPGPGGCPWCCASPPPRSGSAR